MGRHDDHLPFFQDVRIAGYDDLRLPVQDAYECVKGRRVLAEPLPLIEGKQGDRAGLFLDDGTAHDRAGLVFDQPGHVEHLCGEWLFLLLDRGDHDEVSFRWDDPLREAGGGESVRCVWSRACSCILKITDLCGGCQG